LRYPLTSDQILNGRPHSSNSGYAFSKRNLYIASKLLSECSDLEVVQLIPTNLLGEHDNYHLHDSHVIPAIIHKTYLAQKNNKPLVIKGDGSALRSFIYASDLAKIILHFVDCKLENQFNQLIVGPPVKDEITIKELVNKIVKEFDFNGEVVYDSNFQEGQYKKTVDDSELLSYIPHFKFTSLDVALKQTIYYFIDNYDTIRK
jgi:GDP-L-fucose synthase